ncbi:MAG: GAF domain-containing protein [Anaerolineae bacterium]|nr:GAF domain-containing protein [Anaerolineae bacterium]
MTEQSLYAQLALKDSQLNLLLEIDRIRDVTPEPAAMAAAIANTLAGHFDADACLLCLLDRETRTLELKALNERATPFYRLQTAALQPLAERAVSLAEAAIWHSGDPWLAAFAAQAGLNWDDVHVAAVPIIMGTSERLGAVLLVRSQRPFSRDDVALLDMAESQIDSAVVQGFAYHDLQQRNKELETIYRVDRIRDENLSFDDMLNAVLAEVLRAIPAEMGFIMLYNPVDGVLEMRATTHDDLFQAGAYQESVQNVANQALQQAEMICANDLAGDLHAILCIPLILRNEIIGVLGVANGYTSQGFAGDDRRLLGAIGSQMDTAIFESQERRRLRQVLGRSVDPRVLEQLMARPDVDFLKGERLVLTVLYADMRDSTQLAECTGPELLVEFVNGYLAQMTEIILDRQGTLDKFIGDEVMALFGAPFPQPDHALRAVRTAFEMQRAHQSMMDAWRQRGLVPSPIGIGIASGEMIVGEMGCARRTDYTVIGRAANLGSRICGVAGGGEVLVSQETYDMVQDAVEAVPITGTHLKGISPDVCFYRVVRMR